MLYLVGLGMDILFEILGATRLPQRMSIGM